MALKLDSNDNGLPTLDNGSSTQTQTSGSPMIQQEAAPQRKLFQNKGLNILCIILVVIFIGLLVLGLT